MPDNDEPFMEHPTGEFPDAACAMESAIERLRSLEAWDRWITFSGQGQGTDPDSYHIVDLRIRGDEIDLGGRQIDLAVVFDAGGLDPGEVDVRVTGQRLRVVGATSEQFARILDGLFRGQFGVHPFDDGEDYAVGAEWCSD